VQTISSNSSLSKIPKSNRHTALDAVSVAAWQDMKQ